MAPNYLAMYPEIAVSQAERKAVAETRNGALVGEQLVKRFGWKIGDRVPLQSTIFPDRQGSKNWQFEIVGVMHATDKKTGGFFDQMFPLHWKTFDETTGVVGAWVTYLIFNGLGASTMAAGSVGKLAFELRVSPELSWTGMRWA